MAYGKERIQRDSLGLYVLNVNGERMRPPGERSMTAYELSQFETYVDSDEEVEPDDPMDLDPPAQPTQPTQPAQPAQPAVYVPHRKPNAAIWIAGHTTNSSSNIPTALPPPPPPPAPVGLPSTGRGRGRGVQPTTNASRPPLPSSGRGRVRGRGRGRGQGTVRAGGASNPSNTPSMTGPASSFPAVPSDLGHDPATPLTGPASFIPANIDPALMGDPNDFSASPPSGIMGPPLTGSRRPSSPSDNMGPPPKRPRRSSPPSGVMGPPRTGPHRPTPPTGFGGYDSRTGFFTATGPASSGLQGPSSSSYQPSRGYDVTGPHGRRPSVQEYEDDDDDDEAYDEFLKQSDPTQFGDAAGPSGHGTQDYPLTGGDAVPPSSSAPNPPSGTAAPSMGNAPNLPTGKTRGTKGNDNDVRRTAILSAGCPCKRCWVSWIKTPFRQCIIKIMNCSACRETQNQCCIWSDAIHIPAIQHIVHLHNIFLAWLNANPTFDFDATIPNLLNLRSTLKKGMQWPANVPQEYIHMYDAIQALRLVDTRQR